MWEEFLIRLLTPSPIMHWLLMLLPATITLSGLSGWMEKERGNRRLTFWAGMLTIWLFLPISLPLAEYKQLSAMISILGWLGLVGTWGHHVWTYRPTPVWAHALVISHLVALFIGAIVAVIRAVLTVAG